MIFRSAQHGRLVCNHTGEDSLCKDCMGLLNGKRPVARMAVAFNDEVPPPPDLNASIRAAREVVTYAPVNKAAVNGVPAPPDFNARIRAFLNGEL